MGKLVFGYGTMSSAKTSHMLISAFEYTRQNKKVLLSKSIIDDRYGENVIKAKCGLEQKVDFLISDEKSITKEILMEIAKSYILYVDEAQFLSTKCIELLKEIAENHDI